MLCCIDFRFWDAIIGYVRDTLGIPDFDLITEAGGVKYIAEEKKPVLDTLRAELNISFHLHHVNTIILVNHEDCGAYGGKQSFKSDAAEREHHLAHLRSAAEFLRRDHPQARVVALFALFAADGETIEFVEAAA